MRLCHLENAFGDSRKVRGIRSILPICGVVIRKRAHRADVGYGRCSAETESSQETELFSVFFLLLVLSYVNVPWP